MRVGSYKMGEREVGMGMGGEGGLKLVVEGLGLFIQGKGEGVRGVLG